MVTNYERVRQDLMLKLPPIGELVTITLDNSRSPMKTGPYKDQTPDTIDLVGRLVVKDRRIDREPSNFALFVPNCPVNLRIINIFNVVAINGIATFPKGEKKPKAKVKTFQIPGSAGSTYTVTFNGTHWSCTCTGFNFRKNCRHVKQAREQYDE